jgi:hypothetical protein
MPAPARPVGLDAAPRHTYLVAGVLALTLLYSIVQVGFVLPYLPADMTMNLARPGATAAAEPVPFDAWRDAYWQGPAEDGGWRAGGAAWAHAHLGMIVRLLVFTGAAIVLFLLRSHDLTAALVVLALAFSGVAAGGPLLGVEGAIPGGRLLTVFAWMAGPLAFPTIALAIAYFPSPSVRLGRMPWLHAVPLAAAAPMIALGLGTSLYLAGLDAAEGIARWDAAHPAAYYGSFAAALAINLLAVVEGIYRYRFNHDASERRRIRMALYTAVPGIAAYAVLDGLPVVATLAGASRPEFPAVVSAVLHALVLLPAFGLVYAVGVARVLGPRTVLRRSLQYALARRTLTIVAVLPLVLIVGSVVLDRGLTIQEALARRWPIYLVLGGLSALAFRFRDRARQALDERFFRSEYDARKILVSLAGRVRFETDPADLAALVLGQIDEALHPERLAILVSGIEDGRLVQAAALHGSAEPLPLDGGLVAMLRWSDDPLEIFLHDPRSPAHRLPPSEQEWLAAFGAALLVPVVDQEKALVAIIALGDRRSEEAYTSEDRELLASIAAQMGLGFDVARLRLRAMTPSAQTTAVTVVSAQPMTECPRCGRCEDAGTLLCPADGSPMQVVPPIPRTIDNKYRLEQLLGRGGMGAVYRARDMRLDRLVAIKVVRTESFGDPAARRRFRREAQLVARLQHPSIVAIYDYGTLLDGGAYLVMELVRGEDLRRVLLREGRLEPERTAHILTSVCDGIEAAHGEGVLHRDLKPENILLPGGGLAAKVLDFGVAKLVVDDRGDEIARSPEASTVLTAAGMIVGTPAYMAPEQFQAAPADARTDVFSLGVIAYEMLTGELPFGRGSLADVVLAQARGARALPSGIAPAAMTRAIDSALAMEPGRRPASARAFARLLGQP